MKKLKKFSGKIFSVALAAVLSCTLLPADILQAEEGMSAPNGSVAERTIQLSLLYVDNSIQDKDGAYLPNNADGIYDKLDEEGWKWDSNTKTLLLSGANFNVASGNAIRMPEDSKIELVGNNSLKSSDSNGINASGTLALSGSGSVEIEAEYTGIFSGDIVITGGNINVTSAQDNAIYGMDSLDISGSANVLAKGGDCGLQAGDNGMSISGGVIRAESTQTNAIYTSGSLDINGNAGVTAVGGEYCGIQSTGNMVIGDSTIDAESPKDSAIYSPTSITVSEGADITATGKYRGLQAPNMDISGDLAIKAVSTEDTGISGNKLSIGEGADVTVQGAGCGIFMTGDIDFAGCKVEAVGLGDVGIYSGGTLRADGGKIHAKAAEGYLAIGARKTQNAGEAAEPHISVSNVLEKNSGKVLVSDWFESGSEKKCWTTFLGKDETEVTLDASGRVTNGLNEVWLAAPYTVTFDVNGGTGSNTTVKVYPGNQVTALESVPKKAGCHFSGWYFEGTKFDFENGSVTGDMTLLAQLDPHTPDNDDGDCTTAVKCSVCKEIVTAAKTHVLSGWQSDGTAHWKKCTNAGCNYTEQKAAHTPGEAATIKHPQVCTECGYVIAPILPSKNAVVDDSTDMRVEYEDGTAFEASIVLNVVSKPQEEMDQYKNAVDEAAPGLILGGLYDVKLLKDGVAIQPNGQVKVSIPLTEKMKSMSSLKVVYIDDNGKVTIIPSEEKDGMIVFITDHFSYYGVIGKVKEANQGDNNNSNDNNNGNNNNGNNNNNGSNNSDKNNKDDKNVNLVQSKNSTLDTGDSTYIGWYFFLVIAAAATMLTVITLRRRKNWR